ncbi:helix-turn-helix domain-containing protein [Sphaerisporangium sp. NPDC051011]|uniref:helix-turn-helix domain-containing protein n=1 Tax=Sphaerisporangium sp. NPDC051011 TaxID=3155792 RepID=UPI0033E5049C
MNAEINITTREAAAALGVSLRTAQRWAQRGKLTAVKAGGRWSITLATDLRDWKAAQVDKARELIEQGGILPSRRRPGIYTAVSSDGSATYLVHEAACTCPAGMKQRACYHRAAVAILSAAATRRAA